MRARALLVVTEHHSHLTAPRREGYERVRRQLADIAERAVESVHYLEAGDLEGEGPVVLSGSAAPGSAHDPVELGRLGEAVRTCGRPIFGICAGLQLLATFAGGRVAPMRARGGEPERGYLPVEVLDGGDLLRGLSSPAVVYQDHEDEIVTVPRGFDVLARSPGCEVQAVAVPDRRWWGTQFHPERSAPEHSDGECILRNFFELVDSQGG